jgi:diguanylate cyclase (GGDEF)-like protein
MSFRLKIILGMAIIQIAILVVLVSYGITVLRSSNEAELVKRTQTTVRLFATTAQPAVLTSDIASLDSLIKEVLSNPGIVYARVIGPRGVLAEDGVRSALQQTFIADRDIRAARNDVFNTAADIVVAGQIYGRVEIGFSTAGIQQLVYETRIRTLVISGASIALVVLFSSLLGLYLTRGLKALRDGTRVIARGELGYQIPVRGSDELAETAADFNEMSRKLLALEAERARKAKEILRLNLELEQRVDERTQQLSQLNQQLEHQAMHDALTELPNRALFNDRLRTTLLAARREKTQFAVICVDLDLFKEINDTMGHHAGDMVLQHVARACSRTLRDSDTVARMGGDEFAIIMPRVADIESAATVAARLLEAISQPLPIGEKWIQTGASLGLAVYPAHGEYEQELVHHSDAAMYEAKRNKQGVVVYRPELSDGRQEQVALKGELRQALQHGQLVLHYQPKVDVGSHRVSGVEALVRWEHPRLGLLSPAQFIPLAETAGLIKELTLEVVRIALRQIRTWLEAGMRLSVAINISTFNLQDRGFPEQIGELLATHGVPGALLEMEVTETAIMNDPVRAIENIETLVALGVQVSIDDFGTGYSSMAYLQKLLVAKIKIDRSFVMSMGSGENSEAIVRSTIDLAHNLGLKAVAEGVENEHAWSKLKELGCDLAQGYYMSKPLPAEELTEWLRCSVFDGEPAVVG